MNLAASTGIGGMMLGVVGLDHPEDDHGRYRAVGEKRTGERLVSTELNELFTTMLS